MDASAWQNPFTRRRHTRAQPEISFQHDGILIECRIFQLSVFLLFSRHRHREYHRYPRNTYMLPILHIFFLFLVTFTHALLTIQWHWQQTVYNTRQQKKKLAWRGIYASWCYAHICRILLLFFSMGKSKQSKKIMPGRIFVRIRHQVFYVCAFVFSFLNRHVFASEIVFRIRRGSRESKMCAISKWNDVQITIKLSRRANGIHNKQSSVPRIEISESVYIFYAAVA